MAFAIIVLAIIALCVAIPLIIGFYVYKDAKKRNMNYVLWTILSVAAPCFIGFIIYLILRSERPVSSCPQCGFGVSEGFTVCPNCGFSLKNHCPVCGMALEYDWSICPNCANPIPEEMKAQPPLKPQKDKELGKVLALVIIIPILLCVLLIACLVMFTSVSSSSFDSYSETDITLSPEAIRCDDFDISQWCDECDEKGEGIYALRSTESLSDDSVHTSILVYRNDGRFTSMTSYTARSIFKKPTVEIQFFDSGEDGISTLSYCEYEYNDSKGKDAQISITTDGEENDFTVLDVSGLSFDDSCGDLSGTTVKIDFSECDAPVKTAEIRLYDEYGSEISSGGTHAADGGVLGKEASFNIGYDECKSCETISVALLGENEETIAESENYSIRDEDGCLFPAVTFTLTYENSNARLIPAYTTLYP